MREFVQRRRIVVRKLRKSLFRGQMDFIVAQTVKGAICLIVLDDRMASR